MGSWPKLAAKQAVLSLHRTSGNDSPHKRTIKRCNPHYQDASNSLTIKHTQLYIWSRSFIKCNKWKCERSTHSTISDESNSEGPFIHLFGTQKALLQQVCYKPISYDGPTDKTKGSQDPSVSCVYLHARQLCQANWALITVPGHTCHGSQAKPSQKTLVIPYSTNELWLNHEMEIKYMFSGFKERNMNWN